ncbi:gamma-glutamylcyclotransferase family protein [Pseudoalteromonas luteoviolacea]|uniref:gamma-glutamylcyclotransferase family protein n=1 Tax=Pseudoalteromonas luteoviolacea TaxID=43657 RepID=UPI001152F87B|nr:gamma-glutamylcyclotransferase family protein [Pseudoalteromonas luteoviolacea]TQF71031.1 gamma-glutamylcyclotransferase [Pseudoalteromonas luteoviolacea]
MVTSNKVLFVYGTLAPNRANSHLLEDIGGSFEKAFVRGDLFEEGWGAAQGYPGIKLNKEGPRIEGYIFISEQLPNHWRALDDFEGPGYERVECDACTESGEYIKASVYALAK